MTMLTKAQAIIANQQLFKDKGEEAREYQNLLIKPKGSLGILEEISVKLAEITGQVKYNINNKDVLILCGDHGVANHNISAYPKEVTKHMTLSYLKGGAAASVVARANNCQLTVVDMGIEGKVEHPLLIVRKVRNGSRDMTEGPAMTLEETKTAIQIGIEETEKIINRGAQIIAPGEMGIGNTTASSALLAVFGDLSPQEVVGRGSFINDETLRKKRSLVEKALKVNKPEKTDPLLTLAQLGGYEIAAMVGVYIACALHRIPVVVDGFIASAAAITAKFIAPGTERFMFGSHKSAEPAHIHMLNLLGIKPLFDLNMRLGEATGAIMAMQIIQTASKVICEMATFSTGGVAEADQSRQL